MTCCAPTRKGRAGAFLGRGLEGGAMTIVVADETPGQQGLGQLSRRFPVSSLALATIRIRALDRGWFDAGRGHGIRGAW